MDAAGQIDIGNTDLLEAVPSPAALILGLLVPAIRAGVRAQHLSQCAEKALEESLREGSLFGESFNPEMMAYRAWQVADAMGVQFDKRHGCGQP